ncbi:phage holin family protein [Myxococcus sp. SDU36]|uniref:phage holin family protein n=1 Tax=Myxococcus sp. SDU36 TaxID=2831967 RepID=UPI0025439BEA|nr:phage holin family protein [Myxococcus sp. SDU36]WIG95560.1 phage holin family protein [Myxococcus sp. SDU36]
MEPTIPHRDGDGFGALFSEFTEQARRLVRAEVSLARTELRTEAKKASAGAGLLAGGGVVLLLGAITFVAFLVAVLALALPLWASALIVAAVLLAVGGAIAWSGLQRMKQVHRPERTIQTLKEDGQWASKTAHSMKSQMHGHA